MFRWISYEREGDARDLHEASPSSALVFYFEEIGAEGGPPSLEYPMRGIAEGEAIAIVADDAGCGGIPRVVSEVPSPPSQPK
jgi:hypothetical protein